MTVKVTGKGGSTDTSGTYLVALGAWGAAEGIKTKATVASAHAEGTNSQATGPISHAEGKDSVASGGYSHAEGNGTTASGQSSHSEGEFTNAVGQYAHAEGYDTYATGNRSHAEGSSCRSPGHYSHAQGSSSQSRVVNQHALGAGMFYGIGDCQVTTLVHRAETTDATPKIMTADGLAVNSNGNQSGLNVFHLPADRAHMFRISVVARRSDVSGDAAGWQFTGMVARGPSAGSAAFAAGIATMTWSTAVGIGWDVTPSIDTTSSTDNYLKLTVTGVPGQTIRWVARIDTEEVG